MKKIIVSFFLFCPGTLAIPATVIASFVGCGDLNNDEGMADIAVVSYDPLTQESGVSDAGAEVDADEDFEVVLMPLVAETSVEFELPVLERILSSESEETRLASFSYGGHGYVVSMFPEKPGRIGNRLGRFEILVIDEFSVILRDTVTGFAFNKQLSTN